MNSVMKEQKRREMISKRDYIHMSWALKGEPTNLLVNVQGRETVGVKPCKNKACEVLKKFGLKG